MVSRVHGRRAGFLLSAGLLGLAGLFAFDCSASQLKPLYLDNASGTTLSRTPSTSTAVTFVAESTTATFTLSPTTATAMTLGSGNIPVVIWMARQGSGGQTQRSITVTLDYTGGSAGTIGAQTRTITFGANGTLQQETFTINLGANLALNTNTAIRVAVTVNAGSGNQDLDIVPLASGSNSRVELNSNTVISNSSLTAFDAAFAAGSATASFARTQTAYLRAVVSDPFGAYDIAPTGGTVPIITLVDAGSTTQVNAATMTQVASTAATKTYEYAYAIPSGAVTGSWTYTVTSYEGTEGTVTDTDNANFTVLGAAISVAKSSRIISDPVNGGVNPKRIPGATIRYTLTIANGTGANATALSTSLNDGVPIALTYATNTLRRSVDTTCDAADTALSDAYDAADDGSFSGGAVNFGDSNGGTDLSLAPAGSISYCYDATVN